MVRAIKAKRIMPVLAAVLMVVMLFAMSVTVHAAPQYGFGMGEGRTDTINVNDFHTSAWDRFLFNYDFVSGMVYRYDLGSPTTFDGFVPTDVYTANVRRDAHVSLRPPSYGVFSGVFATEPSNLFFPQPVSPAFWRAFELENPNTIPVFDTLQMGVNARDMGNPMNMHNVGEWGVMANTSIGGADVVPHGANNMTGNYTSNRGTVINQSGNDSSTVTSPSAGGFLPPTSIGRP